MEILANTEYQDVYRIVDGVLLIVNKFLYKDYSKKTKRIVKVNDTGRYNCKTYNKGCQSCLKELKRDYLDTYATVTIFKGTVLYHGYPVEPTTKLENYIYETKTTGDAFGGDYNEVTNMINNIREVMDGNNFTDGLCLRDEKFRTVEGEIF